MEKSKGIRKERGAIEFLKHTDAIYGNEKPLSEVVMVFDETGIAKKELLKAIRSSSEIIKINIDTNGINSFITIQEIEVPKNANDLFFRDGIKLQARKSK